MLQRNDRRTLTISVSGAVNVTVVPAGTLVLNVRRVDGDTTGLLFRRVVRELGTTLLSEHLGDSGGQGGFAVIDVTCRVSE